MKSLVIEAAYSVKFRSAIAAKLGAQLKNRHSVVLIGMKRVGISNFLRFFLYQSEVAKTYIDSKPHLFIRVDLNDLVELSIFAFWMLTLKRIADAVEDSNLDSSIKRYIETLFLDSIQSKDPFLTIDYIRRSLVKIIEAQVLPTIFYLRFDRMIHHATRQFLYNLEGLKDATHNKLSYVFTTYRRLDHLSPRIFNLTSLSLASNNIYLQPVKKSDLLTITETYLKHYHLKIPAPIKKALFELVDGYVQYLQLALIILNEVLRIPQTKEDLFSLLVLDERIALQSEELWESLTIREKDILLKINKGQIISEQDRQTAKYLWETGLVREGKPSVFSPIFSHFLNQVDRKIGEEAKEVEMSKKEHLLFSFLQDNINQICEREAIIEAVWPKEQALGISDWAIDRLVARVRNKLKQQNNNFEVVTIKTRGYKLISTS